MYTVSVFYKGRLIHNENYTNHDHALLVYLALSNSFGAATTGYTVSGDWFGRS
jgi:hypothetical protein